MVIALIYVSRRTSNREPSKADLDAWVARSSERNAKLNVRGALLVTRHHIAQILEGPELAIDELMSDIRRQPGHDQVTVIDRRPIDSYRFTDWCFAYWGTATYMDEKIATVLKKHDALAAAGDTTQLFDLMRMLARECRDQKGPIGNPPRH